jgi:hypothetical protein
MMNPEDARKRAKEIEELMKTENVHKMMEEPSKSGYSLDPNIREIPSEPKK